MSAAYLTKYLATFEALPDDIQKRLSLIRQNDLDVQGILREIEDARANLSQSGAVDRLQNCVKRLQDVNVQKKLFIDEIQEILDTHNKQLQQEKQNYLSGSYTKGPVEPTAVGVSSSGTGSSRASTAGGGGKRRARPESRRSKQSKAKDDPGPAAAVASGRTSAAAPPATAAPAAAASAAAAPSAPAQAAPQPAVETGGSRKRSSKKASRKSRRKEQKYCVPGCVETSGDMVACDNQECPGEWFHYQCVGLTDEPTTKKWYCPDCRSKMDKRR